MSDKVSFVGECISLAELQAIIQEFNDRVPPEKPESVLADLAIKNVTSHDRFDEHQRHEAK